MLILKAEVLDAQGCTEQALLTTLKVPDIVRLSVTAYQPSFSQLIDSVIHEAGLLVNLGNSEQALQVAEGALRLSRDNKLEPMIQNLVWSAHAVALAALSCRNYKRAVEVAQEGCNISANPNWQESEEEHNIFIRPNLFAIRSSAEANLGNCSTALEYAQCAVNRSLDIGDMKLYISATTAQSSYMETRGNLADILLATGDLGQSRQICEERSTYFSKRVEKRMGDYREWAPILRMLGILCCGEGLHEEGEAAAKELSRILRMLGSAFPSLQEQVKIRLRHQVKVPILKVLEDMFQKLDCQHQKEVVSLFEI
jgi:tetratricopeptide (TPR) repeat protein